MMHNNNYAQGSVKPAGSAPKKATDPRLELQAKKSALELKILSIRESIRHLENYIDRNRFDRESIREAQDDIEDLESQLSTKQIELAQVNAGLAAVAIVAQQRRNAEIERLRTEYSIIQQRESRLSNAMDSLMINMDTYDPDSDVYTSSERDLAQITAQYADVVAKMVQMQKSLAGLERGA